MALTIGEAQAANDLIRYAVAARLATAGGAGPTQEQDERARAAAVLLADHAHKPLMAGFTGELVLQAWPELSDDEVTISGSRHLSHRPDCGHVVGNSSRLPAAGDLRPAGCCHSRKAVS